jgi:hypothetical protein
LDRSRDNLGCGVAFDLYSQQRPSPFLESDSGMEADERDLLAAKTTGTHDIWVEGAIAVLGHLA